MNSKMQEALRLYFTQSLTQKEIAARIGVTERTIYNWIHQHAWDRLREASLHAPAIIAENLASQIVELQNNIAAREPGKRFPTMEEAELTRKLICSLDKVKKQPSLSHSQQTLRQFNHWLMSRCKDNKFCWHVREWTGDFIQAEAKMGYAPYQVEYGAENIAPVSILFTDEEKAPAMPEAEIPGESAAEIIDPSDNPGNGNLSPEEAIVDNHTETIAAAALQPLPVPAVTPEKVGNEEITRQQLDAAFDQFLLESYPIGQHDEIKAALQVFAPVVIGNNFAGANSVDNHLAKRHGTAF